jgi:predicted SAM-dependent methyltransferase
MPTIKSKIGAYILPLLPVSRRSFDILRHETRAWRTRKANILSPKFRAKIRQLRACRDLSVNIGSGGRGLPGWVNIELVRMRDTTFCFDIRRPLPLADASAVRMLAEHVVEHIDFLSDIPAVFQDWRRILQPGGILRIVVPDAGRFLQAYVAGEPCKWRELGWDIGKLPSDIYTPMHVINHIFHQSGEHLFAYDFETLAWALRRAGFSTIKQMSYGISQDTELAIDQANHAPYSLYVEAIK